MVMSFWRLHLKIYTKRIFNWQNTMRMNVSSRNRNLFQASCFPPAVRSVTVSDETQTVDFGRRLQQPHISVLFRSPQDQNPPNKISHTQPASVQAAEVFFSLGLYLNGTLRRGKRSYESKNNNSPANISIKASENQ